MKIFFTVLHIKLIINTVEAVLVTNLVSDQLYSVVYDYLYKTLFELCIN